MPAADDGEWNSSCSNVVCVRTKSSKETENNEDAPAIHIQPIVVRSVYRKDPYAAAPPPPSPQPSRTVQRRRITRLIQTPTLTPTPPTHYEGISKVSFNLKVPATTSAYNGPDFRPLPFTPSRRSVALRKSFEPKLSFDLPEVSLPPTSGRSFRPVSLAPYIRSSSVPPLVTTPYVRRSSISVPSYSSYSSGFAGRQIGNTGSVMSPLRRGSIDVSYLSRVPDSYKSISSLSGIRPSVPLSSALRSTYRRGSLSVLDRPAYRSSTAGRLIEDEFKSAPLSATSDLFSSLRSRTLQARDKLDTHRSLTDRYLSGSGSRAPSVDNRFSYQADRNSDLDSFSRRTSFSSLPRATSITGSRAPSMDRSDFTSVSRASAPPPLPPPRVMPEMSAARRRIRSVLYKVSGDHEYLK